MNIQKMADLVEKVDEENQDDDNDNGPAPVINNLCLQLLFCGKQWKLFLGRRVNCHFYTSGAIDNGGSQDA